MKLNWESHYIKFFSDKSGKASEVAIRDVKKRLYILFNWIKDKNSKILDCGCHIGTFGIAFKQRGYNSIVGFDIDGKSLKCAKGCYDNVFKMECHNLAFKNNSFDFVIAMNVIEHLLNPEIFLQEVKKIIKNSGKFIFSTPNNSLFRKLIGRVGVDKEHKHFWTYRTFRIFLKRNGFRILDAKTVGKIPLLFGCETFITLCEKENHI